MLSLDIFFSLLMLPAVCLIAVSVVVSFLENKKQALPFERSASL